jgi:23S rRNA pseudouridine955/2504/2580 synthase
MCLQYGKTLIPVLFENSFCLILDKPAGLPVQGGEGVKFSLDSILKEKIQPRPLLVHRLDKDTSGLILVAKTKEAARSFSALFAGAGGYSCPKAEGDNAEEQGKKRAVVKQYLGICYGIPEQKQGVISLSLDLRKGQKKSETLYTFLSFGDASEVSVSLLELELGTGRMHQIRRHLAHIGHPLLGDDKYGDFPLNKQLRKTSGLKHLRLHSSRMIISPSPGLLPDGLDISSPLPDYFSRFVKRPLTIPPHFP